MKRAFGAVVLATTVLSAPAFARKYGSAGCGLGSIVIGPGEGFSQVFAATTNGTSYAQAFGISSGTSNCTQASAAAAIEQQESFMVNNYGTLSKEMAQGQGETLAGLADVLGCETSLQPSVASHLQKSYERIFAAPGAMAALDATRRELSGVPTLASGCSKLTI
jgi:hypothetical protein